MNTPLNLARVSDTTLNLALAVVLFDWTCYAGGGDLPRFRKRGDPSRPEEAVEVAIKADAFAFAGLLPRFAFDPAAALQLKAAMARLGFHCDTRTLPPLAEGGPVNSQAKFQRYNWPERGWTFFKGEYAHAETEPRAIALAAVSTLHAAGLLSPDALSLLAPADDDA